MATRKRRSTRRRRVHARARRHNPVNPVNPVRRRRRSVRRPRRYGYHARRRHTLSNPRHHRRRHYSRRRHSNPAGIIGRAVPLVISSALIGISQQFVAPVVVRFAPQLVSTPIGVAATTFGTGWALSALARAFNFTRRWADDLLLAGAVLAGGQLFSAYVAPMIRLGGGGGQGMGWRYRQGMRGIAAVHGIPPQIMPPPMPPQQGGMQGMATVPGVWNR